MTNPDVSWEEMMRGMLGKRVRVTYSVKPEATVVGILHSFDEGGEVAVRTDDGFIHWCWPNLLTVKI